MKDKLNDISKKKELSRRDQIPYVRRFIARSLHLIKQNANIRKRMAFASSTIGDVQHASLLTYAKL